MPVLNYIITAIVFNSLVYGFWYRFVKNTDLGILFWLILILKIFCGFAIGHFYTAEFDTHQFQEVASKMTALAYNSPGAYSELLLHDELPGTDIIGASGFKTYSNSFFFSKIISILNFITGSRYYLNVLFFAFLSLAGGWYFILTVRKIFPGTLSAAIIGFLLFPSVLFWTSGVLKEGILLAALCVFWATSLIMVYNRPKKVWLCIIVLLLSGWLLWKIKYFVAVLVYGLTGIWFFIYWLKRFTFLRTRTALVSSTIGFSAILVFLLSRLHEQFNIGFLIRRLVWNYNELHTLSAGKPTIGFSSFQPEIGSVLKNIPKAVWSILFRPYIWEGENVLYKMAGLENILLLILFIGAFISIRKVFKWSWPSFYVLLVVFILVLSAMFALSTPNLGSLNRYRVAFLPFLVFLLLQSPFWQRVFKKVPGHWQKG